MAKPLDMLAKLKATPPAKRQSDWFDQLPQAVQDELADVFVGYHKGELKQHSQKWICEQLIEQFKLPVCYKTVCDKMKEARWRQ